MTAVERQGAASMGGSTAIEPGDQPGLPAYDEASTASKLDDQHPWPGLGAYDEASHAYFQGRDGESDAVVQLIETHRVLSLYSRSGLGKSSLLQAGVTPRLRERGYLPVVARLDFTSHAESPWEQLARLLHEAAVAEGFDHAPKAAGDSLWVHLHREEFGVWTPDNQLRTPVFLIDQFEEVFSRLPDDSGRRKRLLAELGDLTENRLPSAVAADSALCQELDVIAARYRMVVSFREDFLADVRSCEPLLLSLTRQVFRLLPMGREQAAEAVRRAGHAVLAEHMAPAIVQFVASVPEPDGTVRDATVEPVVLSLCCTQLNLRRAKDSKIDRALLETVGENIIEDFYLEATAGMPETVRRFIEEQLVQGRTRGNYPRADAIEQGFIDEARLAELTDKRRLLRVDMQGGVPRIELIHDRLVGVVVRARTRRKASEEAAEAKRLEVESRERAIKEAKQRHDRVQLRRTRAALVFLIALLAVTTASLVTALKKTRLANEQADIATQQIAVAAVARERATQYAGVASAKQQEAESRVRQIALLAKYGWVGTDDEALLKNAVDANAAIEKIVQAATAQDLERRRATTVEIFAKQRDVDRVKLALQSLSVLGFRYTVVPAKLPDDSTNAVWYGTHAAVQDAKLVALALMRAGLPVHAVRPLENYFANKDLPLVQAGASRVASSWPRLTAQQVVDAATLPLPAAPPSSSAWRAAASEVAAGYPGR